MAVPSKRWLMLWAVSMLVGLGAGGLYLRANLPPLPGVVWTGAYPPESPAELQRKAESTPAYQSALQAAEDARIRMVLQFLALWLAAGAALFWAGTAVEKSLHRRHS